MVLVTALSLLVIATAIPAGAQELYEATVAIDNITLPQRSTATIPIMITDATSNLSGADINLTYDPTVVQVIDVGNSDFAGFEYNIVNGKVIMAGYGTEDLQVPIKFADVTVKAIGNPGDCTPLNLEGVVYMPSGSPYHVMEFNNGSVCIVAAVPVFNTFGMIALIGLLALVLLVAVRKR